MDKSNLVLIGMPGAGKSTIGVILAKRMKMPFIDTDLLIQQRENRFLQDIIDSDGLERFLSIEEDTLLQIHAERHVIATGGSVVYSDRAMKHLAGSGKVVYLKLKFYQVERRIKNMESRGIAMSKGQRLLDLYREREPLYEKYADMIIDCSGKHIETIISEIRENFQKQI